MPHDTFFVRRFRRDAMKMKDMSEYSASSSNRRKVRLGLEFAIADLDIEFYRTPLGEV